MTDISMSIIIEHWFWFGIVAAVMIWYCTITIYVAVRGAFDIRHMLAHLRDQSEVLSEDRFKDKNFKSSDKK